jgi:MFS family permease
MVEAPTVANDEDKRGTYYGYWIAAACFAIQGIGLGTLMSFGVFFKPLLAEFGWSRAALSGATSVAFLVMGALGVLVGGLNDRFGPRAIMTVTGGVLGLGYLLMSRTGSLWQLYLFYGVVVGAGMSSIDIIALTTTARWFMRRRGAMTGVVKVGTGAGQMTVPLGASLLIAAYGWRSAYLILGALVLIVLVAVSQVLKRDPSRVGLAVDGIGAVTGTHRDEGMALAEAARTKQFWLLCLANFSVIYSLMTIMMHIVPHAADIGASAVQAAGVMSAIGGASMLGRIVTGFAIDRIGSKKSMMICFLILVASLLWVQLARELWMVYLFAGVYGMVHGGFFTVMSPIVAELFGIASHGVLFGVVLFWGTAGGALGPFVAGHVFDVAGSYRPVFLLLVGVGIAGLILTSYLRPAVERA